MIQILRIISFPIMNFFLKCGPLFWWNAHLGKHSFLDPSLSNFLKILQICKIFPKKSNLFRNDSEKLWIHLIILSELNWMLSNIFGITKLPSENIPKFFWMLYSLSEILSSFFFIRDWKVLGIIFFLKSIFINICFWTLMFDAFNQKLLNNFRV